MSIIININDKLDIYYFNENNEFTDTKNKILSYDDVIFVVNKLYNNNEELVIACNFSLNLAKECLNANNRFKYNYYVSIAKQYFKYESILTTTWGSFYTSYHMVPNNITYKILKMLFDYDNSTTFKLLKIIDSNMVEFNDDDLVDINKKIIIKKYYNNDEL
jgi:hypothetical protein